MRDVEIGVKKSTGPNPSPQVNSPVLPNACFTFPPGLVLRPSPLFCTGMSTSSSPVTEGGRYCCRRGTVLVCPACDVFTFGLALTAVLGGGDVSQASDDDASDGTVVVFTVGASFLRFALALRLGVLKLRVGVLLPAAD